MASIYVNINAAGAKNGNSWNDAFTDLQSALAAANSGDEIWVAKGIYKPTITTDRSISFELKDNVAVYGGFVGNEVNLSDRVIADIKDNETILSGDNISYSVVKFNNTSGTTILDGLTIADGNSNDDGGGIYNKGNLTLQNSVVRNNQAADDGGGIRNDGNLTIINSTVADNASLETASDTSGGGGLLNTNAANATVTIINSTFFGNTGKNGGAIRNDGTLNLINSTLSGNTASQSGGGLVNTVNPNNPFDPTGGGNATIINSTITNNTAGNQLGGGIANVGVLTVSNSIIAGNTNNDDIENTFTAFGFTFNGISNSGGSNLIGNGEGTSFTNGDNGDIVGDSSNPINPLLANLQDNGGLTKTHALLNGSLAINAGSNNNIAEDTFDLDGNSNTTENLPFEQRGVGFERILDNTVDIGAYEIVSVVEVSATNADGIYKTGDTVDITVKFAKPVSFNSADGLPQLALETGNNDRVATYKSGNNSDTLTFTYTVQSGDESLDLDYLSKTALEYSSTIKDENGNEVDLTLPNPGETDSLSDNKDIVIDAIAPRVTLNSAASETVNDKFSVSAQFSESVNNFDENDIALSNATISNFSGSDANYSFDITPTETGSVTVDINASVATDIPGNNNIAATQLTREADLTSPTVINVIASTPTISDSTTSFELTVEYSEEMDISLNPVITIENTQNTISLTGGSWNSDSKTYIATYSVADANEELSNIDITVENAEDKFGNLQQSFTQQDVFSIDNRNPGVSLNSTAPATVNSTFNVTAEFSELVNDFDISDITLNNATVDNFVESGNNYSFDVTPSSSGKVTVDINSDVATDNAGNNNIAATQLTREADLTSPTVINVIASTPTISDSTTTFELTVEYSEEMDISVNPVISFPTENPDNTISLTGGSWNSDNKTYKATYSVADANEEVADIDITVENAEDKVGNLQQSFTQQDVFSIDNQNPGVSLNSTAPATVNGKFAVIAQFSELVNDFDINDITLTNATASNFVENFTNYTFDVTPINTGEVTIDINSAVATDIPGNNNIAATQLSREADLTSPTVINVISSTPTISDSTTTFELTVEYSEEMDISVNPVISFPTENPDNTILLTGGSWNSDNKTYKATYSVADANEEVADIDITVENAEDKVGNLQQSFTQQDVFSIDNQNPGVSLNSTAPATVNDKFSVTATFTEAVNNFDSSDITLTNATVDNFVESGNNYSFDVTPSSSGKVTIDINSDVATDNAGNNNIAATQLTREADLTLPTVINVISSTPTISDSTTTFELTVEYSEEMDISVNPVITIENTQNTILLTGGSWNSDSKTYIATYSVADANEEIADIDVKVENAQDKVGNLQQSFTANDLFNIDNKNPDAPLITDFTEDTDVADDGITGDNTLEINGSAEANSNIEIFQNSQFIDTTTADNSGKWNFDYRNTTLEDNTYTFSAIAKDAAGNASDASTPFNITIDAVNDAPALDNTGDMTLNAIDEDEEDTNNQGTLIKDIISSGGGDKITDINVNAFEGIAVTSVDNSNGNWQYSTDGNNWNDFGTVNDTTARLLAADDSTKIRFVANQDYEGAVSITFRAWDKTSGNNGNTADTTNNGGNTTFSNETETAAITVNPVNDAPKLENNTLTISESGSVTISNQNLSATDIDNDDTTLTFTVSNLKNGEFQVNQVAQNSFTQQQINNGLVKFIHDGSENPPSYDVEVSDGSLTTDKNSANITFTNINDAPTLENNTLTISESGSVTISNQNLSATDADNNDTTLTFTVSNLQNGEFQVNQVAQNSFTQQQINNGEVKFIHDGSENPPSYDVEVSDGNLTTDKNSANITFTNINDKPTLKNAIENLTATQDSAFNFTLSVDTFVDSDAGDSLTYSATLEDDSQLPNWLSFTNATFTGTPTADNLGEINIKVTATDKDGKSLSDVFTLKVEKPNNPPIVDDATFSIKENSEENTVVGVVTATDSEKQALEFALAAGNLDLDKDGKLAFAINPDTGEITVNDEDDIDFETTPQFNLKVTATDTSGLNDLANITINLTDVAAAKFDVNASQNGIFVLNGGEKTNIKFTLANIDASIVSEIAVFEVDENGNIDGFAPGSDGYIKAALSKSQVIFSAIANLPNGFTADNIQRVLEINSDARFEFLSISNGTIDTALAEIELTGNTNLSIAFSAADNVRVNNFSSEGFTLELISDIQINAALTQENPVQINQLQTQKELIDLRGITNATSVNVEVYREAAFDNLIGFYQVVDVNGGIDINGDGVADINPNDAEYKNAALNNRITSLDLLSTENQQTATFNGSLEAGSILAPFIIVDGTLDEAINNSAEVYFSFLGANSDKTDHIRLLGDNTFGFEDMVNGGDKDFNDVIMKINL